jgi:hypothetical protein
MINSQYIVVNPVHHRLGKNCSGTIGQWKVIGANECVITLCQYMFPVFMCTTLSSTYDKSKRTELAFDSMENPALELTSLKDVIRANVQAKHRC